MWGKSAGINVKSHTCDHIITGDCRFKSLGKSPWRWRSLVPSLLVCLSCQVLPDDDQPSDLLMKWINNQWSRLISSCPTGFLITLQVSVKAVGFDNRCRAVGCCVLSFFFFFYLFRSCSENILQQLKSWIYLKLKWAYLLWMCNTALVFPRIKFIKKDLKPLSRTLGHILYLMKSSSEVWNRSRLPALLGIFYPVRRARLCSNSSQHNVNFEETNTRKRPSLYALTS